MTAIDEAGTYHDVNRLVVTGLLHDLSNPNVPGALADFYPANLDPEFSGQNLDSGYLTTLPGTRSALFYDTATADPSVIAYDEAHKDVIAANAIATGVTEVDAPAATNVSNAITVPVLIVVGQEDALMCGAQPFTPDCRSNASIRTWEAPYYARAASLTAEVVANTGHDLALHTTANQSFLMINGWIATH